MTCMGCRQCLHQPARGHRGLDLEDQVLGLAVLGRQHARAAGSEESPQGGPEVEGTWVVRHRQSAFVQFGLKRGTVNSRLSCHDEARLVDLQNAVHPSQIDGNAAVGGECAALGSRATTARDDGHAEVAGDAHASGDFLGVSGMDGDVGGGVGQVPMAHVLAHPRPIVGLGRQILGVGGDMVTAHRIGQFPGDQAYYVTPTDVLLGTQVTLIHLVSLSVYRSRY
jgi:hypothetical protein